MLAATRTSERPVGARARCRAAARTPGAATTSSPSKLNSAKVTGLQGRPPVCSQPHSRTAQAASLGACLRRPDPRTSGLRRRLDVRRRSRSVSGAVSTSRCHSRPWALQPTLISTTRNLDLDHDEPVISGDDNALFGSRQLMSNRDSEQIAWVVIDTILLFPTHQDFAHAFRRATFTASRSQLGVVRHGTSVRPGGRNHSHADPIGSRMRTCRRRADRPRLAFTHAAVLFLAERYRCLLSRSGGPSRTRSRPRRWR